MNQTKTFTYYVVEKDGKYLSNGEGFVEQIRHAHLFSKAEFAADYRSDNPSETVKTVKIEVL